MRSAASMFGNVWIKIHRQQGEYRPRSTTGVAARPRNYSDAREMLKCFVPWWIRPLSPSRGWVDESHQGRTFRWCSRPVCVTKPD